MNEHLDISHVISKDYCEQWGKQLTECRREMGIAVKLLSKRGRRGLPGRKPFSL